jgi:hypothetical protein
MCIPAKMVIVMWNLRNGGFRLMITHVEDMEEREANTAITFGLIALSDGFGERTNDFVICGFGWLAWRDACERREILFLVNKYVFTFMYIFFMESLVKWCGLCDF